MYDEAVENLKTKNAINKKRYDIQHVNSHNYTATKNYYLLVQITDILRQLYEKVSNTFKKLKKTAKEKSSDLLEAIRTRKITDEDITTSGIQVRLT